MTRFALGMSIGPDGPSPVVVTDGRAVPLTVLLPGAPAAIDALLPDWDAWCDRIEGALDDASAGDASPDDAGTPEAALTFGVPLPAPPTIYACGANYYDHVEEMKGRIPDKSVDRVFHFLVPSSALAGNGDAVRRPKGCEMLDYEVELVAVLGRGGENVAESEALGLVAGYTVVNDVSLRDKSHQHPIFGANFLMAKGQATMKPLGPVVVPARFVADPSQIALSLHVNGEVRQDGSTKTMIWSLAEQIAALSEMTPLRPGDLIMTGTPAGTSAAHGRYLADGDVMTAHIEGIGTLTNRVAG